MKQEVREHLMRKMAEYIIENDATIRETAKYFGWSKSTVCTYCTKKLKEVDYNLFVKVNEVILKHKEERSVNGGNATSLIHKTIFKAEIDKFLEDLNKEHAEVPQV